MPTASSTSATRWSWSPGTRSPINGSRTMSPAVNPRVERAERVLEARSGRRAGTSATSPVARGAPPGRRTRPRPDVARSRPSRMRTSVDLPEPDSPTMPTDAPASTARSTPPSASRSARGSEQRRAGQLVHAADPGRASSNARHAGLRPASAGSAVRSAAASSSTVYGSPGRSTIVATGPASTMRPWRITISVVGHQRHQGDVVGDEQQRGALGGDQLGEQRQHLGLHRDVERGRRLVGDQQRRPAGERDGDADALSLTSRELVRIGPCGAFGFGQPDAVAQLDRGAVAPRRRSMPRWRRSGSAICLPTRISGLSDDCGFWNTIAIRSPRSFDSSPSERPSSC